jgi:RNA polymerase sigma-70 factor, ECF subfamily
MNGEQPPQLRVIEQPVDRDRTEAEVLNPDAVYRKYSGYVATVAYRILGRDSDVEDVVQDVFIHAIAGLKGIREPDSIKWWLRKVAVRCASRRLSRRRLKGFLGLDDVPDYRKVADNGASPEDRDLLARIYETLDGVPVKDRVAWSLRYMDQESLEDVAKICSCSLATAKRRISAAKKEIDRTFSGESHEF